VRLVQHALAVQVAGQHAAEGEAVTRRVEHRSLRLQGELQPVVELLHLPQQRRLLPHPRILSDARIDEGLAVLAYGRPAHVLPR